MSLALKRTAAITVITAAFLAACTTGEPQPARPSPEASVELTEWISMVEHWRNRRQHTTIEIQDDAKVSVTDRISIVVEPQTRDQYPLMIPLRWPDFGAPVEIRDLEVTEASGTAGQMKMLHEHPYGIGIVIGDAQQFVHGDVSFALRYVLADAIRQTPSGSRTFEWLVTHGPPLNWSVSPEPFSVSTDVVVDVEGARIADISCREVAWRENRMQPAGPCAATSVTIHETGLRYDDLPGLHGIVMTVELD